MKLFLPRNCCSIKDYFKIGFNNINIIDNMLELYLAVINIIKKTFLRDFLLNIEIITSGHEFEVTLKSFLDITQIIPYTSFFIL